MAIYPAAPAVEPPTELESSRLAKIKGIYMRLDKIKGNSKAAVAAASKLLKVVYWVMKEKRKYNHHI